LIVSVPSGGFVLVNLLSNASAAGSWDRHDQAPSNVSWSTNTLDYAGSITSASWNGNVVAYNRGGTGQSSAFVAGGVIYGSTTSALAVTAVGTIGQVLTSAGSGTPTWATPTTGTVTSVTGTAPVVSSGGNTPAISMAAATTLVDGYLTSADWATFNGKQAALVSGTNIKTVNSNSLLGSGNVSVGTVTSVGGTGTVNGLSLSGTVTSSGNLTLGGTLDLSSPPAIGETAASTGRFTTVTSTVATGTAPFTVTSTTPVTNLSIGGNAGTVTNGVYTTDTGTVTNTMLAGSIANAKLTNSSITFGSTTQALGSTVSGLSGVTIDNGVIGGNTAVAGTFTTLSGTTSVTTPIVQNSAAAAIAFKTNSASSAITQFNISHTASAINYVQVTGGATGGTPAISAQGSDAAVSLNFISKGTGVIRFYTATASSEQFRVTHTTGTIVNYATATGAISGAGPIFSVAGTDADIDLNLTPKGAGAVRFGTHTGTILTPTGYITIKDSGGTTRRLLVG
jgi:hypothetical protein